MQLSDYFPQEHFIKLQGLDPHFVGRIILFKANRGFDVEIDIVQSETGKIYNHVRSLYNQEEPREALDSAVQYLKDYLHNKANML